MIRKRVNIPCRQSFLLRARLNCKSLKVKKMARTDISSNWISFIRISCLMSLFQVKIVAGVINCIGAEQIMSAEAVSNTKYAKMCYSFSVGVPTTYSALDACIADSTLMDKRSSQLLVRENCGSENLGRRRRSLALNFSFPSNEEKKWSFPIKYSYKNLTRKDPAALMDQVTSYVQRETCVTFQNQQSQSTANLLFADGSGCLSYIGRQEENQTLILMTLACYEFGPVLNLLAKTLGLQDDVLRPDFDSYIYVNLSNTSPGSYVTFPPPTYLTYGLPYDYASVLHSSPLESSANNQRTIGTIQPLFRNTIGQRVQLSFIDAKLINLLYCAGACSGRVNDCEKGGYLDPNNCNQCKCPDGWNPLDKCRTITPTTTTSAAAAAAAVAAVHDIALCGQQTYNLSEVASGVIKSPFYPDPGYNQTAETQCTWLLTAPVGAHVKITFNETFGIYQHSSQACYHWVEIRFNGSLNDTGPRFCGQAPLAQQLKSKDNIMMILFRSFTPASETFHPGFQIRFDVDYCTYSWSDVKKDTHSFGGRQLPGPLSREDCMIRCELDTSCRGVDVNYDSVQTLGYPTCYLLDSTSGDRPPQFNPNTDEYLITRVCPTSQTTKETITTTPATSTTPTTTPSTTPSTTPTTTPSTMPSTAQSTTSSTTLTITPSTTPTPASSITSATASPPSTSAMPTTQENVETSVAPVFQCFDKFVGQQSSGAQRYAQASSLEDCLQYCIRVTSCPGIDFYTDSSDTSHTECWFYDDPVKFKGKYSNPNIAQYENKCNSTATMIFTAPTSTTTKEPTSTSTITTTSTTPTTPTTTPSTITSTTTTTSTTAPSTTTTEPPTSTSTTTTSDTVTTTASTTMTSAISVPTTALIDIGPTECPTIWNMMVGVQSSGATMNPDIRTENECVRYCNGNLNCQGVDVVTTSNPPQCWVYMDPSLLVQKYGNKNVTQYQFTRFCSTTNPPTSTLTTSAQPCQNSWIIRNGSHSVGAIKTLTPMLLTDCLNYCGNNTQCVAVDYNAVASPCECWIHTNVDNLNVSYADPNINQYVLGKRCPPTAPPPSGCGGSSGNPGEFCLPCSSPSFPPGFCQKKIIKFVFDVGCGCWNQRIEYVTVQCVVLSCTGDAQLVTVFGTQMCVVAGWSAWSACSASCGAYGVQMRYRYAIVNGQYLTTDQQQQTCNVQACPCSGWTCSRCCVGFYENNGYCFRY